MNTSYSLACNLTFDLASAGFVRIRRMTCPPPKGNLEDRLGLFGKHAHNTSRQTSPSLLKSKYGRPDCRAFPIGSIYSHGPLIQIIDREALSFNNETPACPTRHQETGSLPTTRAGRSLVGLVLSTKLPSIAGVGDIPRDKFCALFTTWGRFDINRCSYFYWHHGGQRRSSPLQKAL